MGAAAATEYVDLWRRVQSIQPSAEPDRISWKWTDNGIYTASSAYKALFHGSTASPFWHLIWRSWAPDSAKFFLWLASMDRCWTAERRALHGLPHDPLCKLCGQELESLDHLLARCVFSRITWHEILPWCRLPIPTPCSTNAFFDWWCKTNNTAPASSCKGINSLVALTAWSIWKHRNAAVFDNARPSNDDLARTIKDEARLWARVGATKLASIIPVT
ncbi:hypothetical protein ACQJBY_007677 [Aegilops geniculata]